MMMNSERLDNIEKRLESIERKLAATSTIVIMTAGFYACWTPYAIKCLLSMAAGLAMTEEAQPTA